MTEEFIIPYPSTDAGRKLWNREYGFNAYWAGKHHAKRAKDAQYWHTLVKSEMTRQKVRKVPFANAVVITFYWNDRLDCSNHSAMGKMIEDAIKGRIIKDDSRRYVRGVEHYFHNNNHIRVVIREV